MNQLKNFISSVIIAKSPKNYKNYSLSPLSFENSVNLFEEEEVCQLAGTVAELKYFSFSSIIFSLERFSFSDCGNMKFCLKN